MNRSESKYFKTLYHLPNSKSLSNISIKHSFGKRVVLLPMILLIPYLLPLLKPRCFSKDWDVTEYGVCELTDIVSEIPDTTICLSQQDNEMVICIPKRGMWLTFARRILSTSCYFKIVWHGRCGFPSLSMLPEDSTESTVWKLLLFGFCVLQSRWSCSQEEKQAGFLELTLRGKTDIISTLLKCLLQPGCGYVNRSHPVENLSPCLLLHSSVELWATLFTLHTWEGKTAQMDVLFCLSNVNSYSWDQNCTGPLTGRKYGDWGMQSPWIPRANSSCLQVPRGGPQDLSRWRILVSKQGPGTDPLRTPRGDYMVIILLLLSGS